MFALPLIQSAMIGAAGSGAATYGTVSKNNKEDEFVYSYEMAAEERIIDETDPERVFTQKELKDGVPNEYL